MKTITLICGTGASTTFMAISLKKAIKSQNLGYEVTVTPEISMWNNSIEKFDQILIAPHLSCLKDELLNRHNIKGKVHIIPVETYATMDGLELLEFIKDNLIINN
ncbi:PTS sugar transporter subunit IIB [Vibrio quintilis]|uniref:PTS system, Lactose/Cellobiose specific IIB subunit n=1 Tax=Vibrio quintilis TaxID=1117707 RepID=A0A1M7Z1R4_9VIBR|nr:hypothetical protein [Vibrio quintilis]SHO58752.1 PTS system, Lactose/Cellobiose specific IIB subunit [Vibrio quintilis]